VALRFSQTAIKGATLVGSDVFRDPRGSFFRSYDEEAFAARGLPTHWPEHNVSVNPVCGTLRGVHYQRAPHGEAKLVRCVAGEIYCVVVDVRRSSPTAGKAEAIRLSAGDGRALHVPEGCASGFQTLVDATVVLYLMSAIYVPEAATGVRYNDPALGIAWPLPVTTISDKDRTLPTLAELRAAEVS